MQFGFYKEVLGFTVRFEAGKLAFLQGDSAAIRLVEVDRSADLQAPDLQAPDRQNRFYMDVDEVHSLFESMINRLVNLPEGRYRAPFDQDYRQREFHVIDEDCTLI